MVTGSRNLQLKFHSLVGGQSIHRVEEPILLDESPSKDSGLMQEVHHVGVKNIYLGEKQLREKGVVECLNEKVFNYEDIGQSKAIKSLVEFSPHAVRLVNAEPLDEGVSSPPLDHLHTS
ncbi:hypothetical protein TanjilG_24127 [Lupinus angustifolius]|uniref:Uncharacterized protein n=1 Tax=Lupinus angustifolius TaxID=3871 RepID=A0A1J7I8V2_LUPAN|nr:hypothetical protein TanjilG_24127 [Lupinus angustifolius]